MKIKLLGSTFKNVIAALQRYLAANKMTMTQFNRLPANRRDSIIKAALGKYGKSAPLVLTRNGGAKYPQTMGGVGSYDDNEEEDFSGMGAGTDQSQITQIAWYEQVGKAVASVVPAYAAYDLERRKAKINIARAKQGLDPIDTGATATVGLSADTKKYITYAGIGVLAVLVLPKLLKK